MSALPSDIAHMLLSFLPGRSIPSLLGVSHTAQRLCTCLHELDLSSCEKLDDARFVSSLVRLRSLDLSDCSEQLDDVTPLSSLISLNCLSLGKRNDVVFLVSQLVDLSPLSSLVALKTLHLVRCGKVSDLLPLSTLTSLTSLDFRQMLLAERCVTSVLPHLPDQLEPVRVSSVERCVNSVVSHLLDEVEPVILLSVKQFVIFVIPHLLDQLEHG